MAATPSIDRHLYSALLPTSVVAEKYVQRLTTLTNMEVPGYFEADFSPGMNYYLLAYKGPDVPWTRLMEVEENGTEATTRMRMTPRLTPHAGFDILLEGNGELNRTLSEYMRPLITRTTIQNEGYGGNPCIRYHDFVDELRRSQHAGDITV